MKKNGLFTMVAILMAAMLATGCSKSESENMEENRKAELLAQDQRLKSEIRQRIVGTWDCEGECEVNMYYMDPFWNNVTDDQIVIDNIPLSNLPFYHHSFKFSADGSVELYIPVESFYDGNRADYPNGKTSVGSYIIKSFVIATGGPYPYEFPPFGINIDYGFDSYKFGNYVEDYNLENSHRILFSPDNNTMYVFSLIDGRNMLRYKRTS